MEMEEIQTQECKFSRISSRSGGNSDTNKIAHKEQYQDEEDDAGEGDVKKMSSQLVDVGRFCGWPSSRIVRVSRASGGKDRHSKVWTSKGLRDRRVRLSVNTAIQFYDLQDRLGYDQPSKAVEWLLKAAAPSISELPPLDAFPDSQQLSDEKRSSTGGTELGFDSADVEMDGDPNYQQQQQQQQPCSSNSETSKGSGLSLSRPESRIKARERARERAVEKEKEKENESAVAAHHHNMHPSSSFTELLTGGMNNNNNNSSPDGAIHQNMPRQWSTNPLEYFTSGLLGPSSTRGADISTGFSGQIYVGSPLQPLLSMPSSMFSEHHPELQHFPFGGDNLVPVATAGGGSSNNNGQSNNLNFSISSSSGSASGYAGYNRGTLQSNSSSPSNIMPHFQRFSPVDGSQSLFLGTTIATAAPNAYDARLQLFYGNGHGHGHGSRQSDQKGKEKN